MTPEAVRITTGKAAERLGVGTSTLRRWAKEGRVRHVLMPSGQMRFDTADLDAMLVPQGSAPEAIRQWHAAPVKAAS